MYKYLEGIEEKRKLMDLYYWYIGEGYFLDALNRFKNEDGFGIENIRCLFQNDYEPWEEEYFEGRYVAFIAEHPAVSEDIIAMVDYETFYEHLRGTCEKYIRNNKSEGNKVKTLLLQVQNRLIIV